MAVKLFEMKCISAGQTTCAMPGQSDLVINTGHHPVSKRIHLARLPGLGCRTTMSTKSSPGKDNDDSTRHWNVISLGSLATFNFAILIAAGLSPPTFVQTSTNSASFVIGAAASPMTDLVYQIEPSLSRCCVTCS